MIKSKYLILSGLYFNFNDDLSEIITVKELLILSTYFLFFKSLYNFSFQDTSEK